MVSAGAGLLMAFALGLGILCLTLKEPLFSGPGRLSCWGLAMGLGLGATSLIYFLLLALSLPHRWIYIVEGGLLIPILLTAIKAKKDETFFVHTIPAHRSATPGLLSFFLILGVVFFSAGALFRSLNQPLGAVDAWAIWNYHARVLYGWLIQGNTPVLAAMRGFPFEHGDYPLLIPLSISRLWSYAGEEIHIIPSLVNQSLILGTGVVLFGAIARLKNSTQACFALFSLIGSSSLLKSSSTQYADLPIGYYYLCTLVLFYFYDKGERKRSGYLILAGLSAGLAAWTKNEGMLFLLAVVFGRSLMWFFRSESRRVLGEMGWFFLGASPALATLAIYKIQYAPPGDLLTMARERPIIDLLLDPHRYGLILERFAHEIPTVGKGLVVILPLMYLLSRDETGERWSGLLKSFHALTIGAFLAGLFVVYLTTYHVLEWHLKSSLGRLLLQLLPSVLFIVFSRITIQREDLPEWLKGGG